MDERLSVPAPRTAKDYKAAIDELLAEMRRMNEQMGRDRGEIDRLKTETQELRAETGAVLVRLGGRL